MNPSQKCWSVLSGGTPGQHSQPTIIYSSHKWFSITIKGHVAFLINFADDTKCLHVAKTNANFITMQNVACNLSKECSLSFNWSKSAVLHFWYNHETPANYLLNNNNYYNETRNSIKDLRIMITSDLFWLALYLFGAITTLVLLLSLVTLPHSGHIIPWKSSSKGYRVYS